ncbi:MAG: hypothetical protein LBC70_09655 [Chitinispirillales bacterium]|jgi:predicted RNA-binding Zn-ribbon protein involved in translation (DUF1610 family)|nr:hypothetical protein [Chitinispirillales bacterium]
MKVEGYKCPNCSGAVKFDSSVQKMKCPYCDTEFETAVLEEYQKELEAIAQDDFGWDLKGGGEEWAGDDLDCLTTGSCPSCGAELYGNESTVAMVCPCCGNAQIIAKRLDGMLKPDFVIPFRQDKKAAAAALKNFCKGKPLLPKFFVEENNINCVQGIYAPYWLFDADAHGHIHYKATKVKKWADSRFHYVRTDHYSVVRDGNMGFEKIPVDASEKMDDAYMDAIEPFEYKTMENFHTSFLAGYAAEKYDVSADNSKGRAERRVKSTIEKEFAKSVTGYATVRAESTCVDVKKGKVSYALFPVWTLNTKYKEKNYQFMMNGQTGRLVGKLPVDKTKALGYSGLFTAAIGAALTLGAHLYSGLDALMILIAWVIAAAAGFSIVHYWKMKMNTARLKTLATEYMIPGSLSFKIKNDRFLFSKTTKTPRETAQTAGRVLQKTMSRR